MTVVRGPGGAACRREVYRLEIDLWYTSDVFQPGHRTRIDLASSAFPKIRSKHEHKAHGTATSPQPASLSV